MTSMTEAGNTTTYDYGMFGELLRVDDGTSVIEYEHDAFHRRVGKRVNGTLVQGFLYQDQLNPIAELDGSGNVVSRFVYATRAHVPDFMIRGNGTYAIITDHLGSVRMVVDTASGVVMQELEYDEFGVVLVDSSPGFQPFGFAGGLYDANTELVRFGARDYAPDVGRWCLRVPITFDGGTNLFGYVGNNPPSLVDPSGLFGERPQIGLVKGFLLSIFAGSTTSGLANAATTGDSNEQRARAYSIGATYGLANAIPYFGTRWAAKRIATANLDQCLVEPRDPDHYVRMSDQHSLGGTFVGFFAGIPYGLGAALATAAVGGGVQILLSGAEDVRAEIAPGLENIGPQAQENQRRKRVNPRSYRGETYE